MSSQRIGTIPNLSKIPTAILFDMAFRSGKQIGAASTANCAGSISPVAC